VSSTPSNTGCVTDSTWFSRSGAGFASLTAGPHSSNRLSHALKCENRRAAITRRRPQTSNDQAAES
jgi:hypothetical protein